MKLNNGKNIILDSDVTVSNGGSLSEILNQHLSELDQLKSNVKWLYKYGGVGSGTGGSGSIESSKWYILVDVNGTSYLATSNDTGEISVGNLIVNGQDNYKINIKVLRPGGSSFSAKVSWFNGTSTSTIRKSLNSENSWTIEENIYLGGNNTISVQVTDNEYTAILNINYITSPYVFNLELADADGSNSKVSGSDIFIGNIQETGLKAKLSYDIGIEVAEDTEGNKNGVTYTITDILGNVKDTQILDLSQGNKGFIMLDLVDDPNFLLNDNNSATYTYYLTIDVVTKGGGTSSTEKFELSFNLIPSSLYLKIIPDIGTIYRTEQTKPEYVYSTGAKSFSITPFFGKNTGKSIVINISVDGTQQIEDTSIRERQTLTGVTLDINNTEEDILSHIINFNASYGNITKTFTYYLYSRQLNSNLKWYPVDNNSELKEPDKKNYWRSVTDHTFDLTNTSALLMTSLSDDVVINLEEVPDDLNDFLFAAGILYSEINSSQTPLISLHCSGSNGDEAYINIYYDKVVLASSILGSGSSIDCYINKTPYSDFVINSKNYHLFLIYKRLLKHDVDSDDWYYEIAVYIDGVLERTFSTWSKYRLGYDQIILHPSNYYINLLELSYFKHSLSDKKTYDWMTDANIVRYWYTYQSQKLDVQDLNINILGEFENNVELLLDSKYYDISVLANSASVKQIAKNSKVPILKFSYTEKPDTTSFLDWFVNDTYGENDSIPPKLVGVLYSSGGSELTDIVTDGCQFFISIQGSTTRKYRGKNFELSLESIFSDDTYKYIFSPNFKEYKGNNEDVFNTFLPEQSFTLKADAVDSSHSNNTTMGDFINKNTTHFADASLLESTYGKYIKNCLTGFPVLVFIDVTQTNGIPTTYYLGIYNFNLGRKSFFNLGYIDTKILDDVTDVSDRTTGLKEGFHIYKVLSDSAGLLPSFLTAEVSNNDSHFDFSQYHPSILLRDPDIENDLFGMFGDIETKMTFSEYEKVILNMVKSVAKAGHYVFKSIGKNFSDDGGYNEGYSSTIPSDDPDNLIPKNQVPNYKVLFRKELDPNGVTFVKTGEEVFDGTSLDFNSLINPFINTNGTTNNVDYQSLVEYYTICMIFGLFDSVYKNLNIRTWNGNRFYIAFYDMDTCLGVDNAGNDSDYFAFSDYWDSSYEEVEINGEKILRPSNINVYRDFSKVNSHGFDLPSSYLFAIAKYGKIFQNDTTSEDGSTMDLTFPSRLWAKWRNSKKGELRNAEYFIEHYYKHHLNGVDELMLNYNYRTKYFALTKETTGEGRYGNSYDTTNHNKFKGRRLEYVRLWLDGRFHLLDAYFNLPRANNPIMKLDINTKTWSKVEFYGKELFEPVVDPEEVDAENPDIHVIHSIFGNAARIFGEINFVIKTASHSPLFIIHPGVSTEKRLFKDNNVYYNVFKESDGYNNQILGGSSLWTELASINGFSGAFYLQSDLLSNLNGDKGTINTWDINLPSIKTISLTSPNYSGTLELSETKNTPDLTSVNISNSQILLKLNLKPSLKTIIANNCRNASLDINNCNNIENIALSGTFGEVNIEGIPISVNLNNIKSTSIRMTTNKSDLTFSLSNDTTITTLELKGFKSVNVLNCTKLKKVIVSGTDTLFITITNSLSQESLTEVSLNITNCTLLNLSNNFNLKVLNLTKKNNITNLDLHNTSINKIVWDGEENNEYLDLSYFSKVTTLNLLNNNVVEYIQFKNDKNNPITISSTFKDCTNLKRVYGNISINTSNCFKDLKFFSIHGSNPTTYKGRSIYDNGRVIPVYELLEDRTNSNPISDDLYQEGTKVTNISFQTADATGTYYGTNCTLFDIYYTFYNIGDAKNVSWMFTYLKSSAFDWTSTVDNSPNRYMFRKASNITRTQELFRTELEDKKIRLFSPTEINNKKEIGLFTPLTKVTHIIGIFLGYNYVVDRNVFRLDDELLSFDILYLLYFNPKVIVDNVDNLEQYPPSNTIEPSILNSWGNISGFFTNLTKLINLGITFNTLYINYEESEFKIPSSVESMDKSFVSTYGKGIMKFISYFNNDSKLKSLRGSFCVTEPLPDGTKVSLVLSNDMFDNFKNTITYIGYYKGGDNYASTFDHGTFSGNGIEKSLKNGEFPYTITHNLPHLQQFSGIFSGIKTGSLILPGLMFEYNPELTDISAAFYNLYANIELTANGFANCPNLSKASYLFAKEFLKNNNNDNLEYKISSTIPYKFFYHGEYTRDVLIKGCYESDLQRDEEGRIVYPNVPLEISFQIKTPIATITDLSFCFKNNDINYYTETFEDKDIENNPDYNPFDYIFQNDRWTKNTKKDSRLRLFYWKYNGALNIDGYSPDEYVILDEMKVDRSAYNNEYKIENFSDIAGNVSDMTNFFCSPDLLRYCTSNCNITGLFNSCGKVGASLYPSGGSQYEALRGWGIKGRICPYLLKPVSGVLDLSNFMDNCKGLSNYVSDDGSFYLIPKTFFTYTPNVNNLSYSFSNIFFAENTKLDVFSSLKLNLTVTGIFFRCLFPLSVSNVFSNNNVSETTYAFAVSERVSGDQTPRFEELDVTFENVFKDYSKIKGNNNYLFTFNGYKAGIVKHEGTKTLSAEESDHNYTTI